MWYFDQTRNIGAYRRTKRRVMPEKLERRDLLAGDLPLISEFMASNENTIEDGFGKSPDWIEIRNPTEAQIDLAGWYLTDDPQDLSKWQFPSHASSVLDPFEYLVVFASDRDTIDPKDYPHTNFKLSAGGEFVALVDPELVVVSAYGSDATTYPSQETDVSYGIEGGAFASSDIQYIDATSGIAGNTRLTIPNNGTTFEPSGVDIGNQGNDGKWEQRTFANGGTIFETGADTSAGRWPSANDEHRRIIGGHL